VTRKKKPAGNGGFSFWRMEQGVDAMARRRRTSITSYVAARVATMNAAGVSCMAPARRSRMPWPHVGRGQRH
jgi:hypothetical protein